jgi:hypothetical protein
MLRHPAAIASRLACRDDRDTPLLSRQDEVQKHNFRKSESGIFFITGLEQAHRSEMNTEISFYGQIIR